jgi:integrase
MPKITKAIIDALQPGQADAWAWDSTLPGFGVRAQLSGRKTYVARYRTLTGRQRKLTVGRCCDMGPDQARDMARQVFAAAARGEDPASERAADRQAPTMRDLEARYWVEHAPYKRASSLVHDRRNWPVIIAAMGAKRVADVTRGDCVSLHAGLAKNPVKANHVRALLSKAMTLSIGWGWRTDHPVRVTTIFRIAARETILSPQQLADMNDALHQFRPAFADLVRLLALTGCRLREVLNARRDWVDLERAVLVLPDSKTGPRVVPLPAAAVAIIKAMPEGQEWLIPGKLRGQPLRRPHAAWLRLIKAARLPPGLRIHDLRHTAGSLGHAAGLSQRQIADQLGHRNLATTARYLHGVGAAAATADAMAAAVASRWRAA